MKKTNPIRYCIFSLGIIASICSQGCKNDVPDLFNVQAGLLNKKESSVNNEAALASSLVTTYKGLTITFNNNLAYGTITRPYTGFTVGQEKAYDYSVDLVKDITNSVHRLFHGGRFKDYASDGDHVFERKVSFAGAGNIANWNSSSSWISPPLYPSSTELPRGLWRQPQANGADPNNWDAGNNMDPEVIKVGSRWYCYTQTEITGNRRIDQYNETPGAGVWADRIKLYTSTNGEGGWSKYLPGGEDRGVVINLPAADRRKIQLDHHEMMYEAGAAKPWVMYVFWHLDGVAKGHVRIRSTTPHTFDWTTRESCSGMSQIGNKVGYVDVTGGRLYCRITFRTSASGKKVPTFQFSSDGLSFSNGSTPIELIGHPSLNLYFLGFATFDGTGKMGTDPTNLTTEYGGSASVSPAAPEIFDADIWLGRTKIDISGTLVP